MAAVLSWALVSLSGCIPPKQPTVVEKPQPKEWIVTIQPNPQGTIPKPYRVDANPTTNRANLDLVRWVNDTDHEFRLTFKNSEWPFDNPPCDIVVPKHGRTGWYRVRNDAGEHGKHLEFYYIGDVGLSGPPGDPMVDVDG